MKGIWDEFEEEVNLSEIEIVEVTEYNIADRLEEYSELKDIIVEFTDIEELIHLSYKNSGIEITSLSSSTMGRRLTKVFLDYLRIKSFLRTVTFKTPCGIG